MVFPLRAEACETPASSTGLTKRRAARKLGPGQDGSVQEPIRQDLGKQSIDLSAASLSSSMPSSKTSDR